MATRLPMMAAGATAAVDATLERCGPDDRFLDYILSPYEPRAPFAGKLRSVNALYESFRIVGVEDLGRRLVAHVRGTFGSFRTVFGIKHRPGAAAPLGWELYFYDFGRVHADVSIPAIAALLAPFVRVEAAEPWPLPWLMVSVEIGLPQLVEGAAAAMDVYCDLRSYKVRGGSWELENVYTFHDPVTEIDAILHRAKSLVHFDATRWNLARILHPDLITCHRFCVANKRRADAVYAARISTGAAERFLRRHGWPAALPAFFARHRGELEHLSWDVGLDFTGMDGALCFTKASLYGAF